MACLMSGFLSIAIESIIGSNAYNSSNRNDISINASGGFTPNVGRMTSIIRCATSGGKFAPNSDKNITKNVKLAFLSRFLCSLSTCVFSGEIIRLLTFFAFISSSIYMIKGT